MNRTQKSIFAAISLTQRTLQQNQTFCLQLLQQKHTLVCNVCSKIMKIDICLQSLQQNQTLVCSLCSTIRHLPLFCHKVRHLSVFVVFYVLYIYKLLYWNHTLDSLSAEVWDLLIFAEKSNTWRLQALLKTEWNQHFLSLRLCDGSLSTPWSEKLSAELLLVLE